MTPTEKAIIEFCGHHADWWPSTTQVQEMLALAQPCSTCEALARTVMLDQTSHDTQRKPLSEHEIAKILDCERMKWHKSPPTYEFDLAFARAIEAAHGIKDTRND